MASVMRGFVSTLSLCGLSYVTLVLAALFCLPRNASFSAFLREAHSPLLAGAAWLLGLGVSLWCRAGRIHLDL